MKKLIYLVLISFAMAMGSCSKKSVPTSTSTTVSKKEAWQPFTIFWERMRIEKGLDLKFSVSQDVTFSAPYDSIYSDEYGKAQVVHFVKQYTVKKGQVGELKTNAKGAHWIYFEPSNSEEVRHVAFVPNGTRDVDQWSLRVKKTESPVKADLKDNGLLYTPDAFPVLTFIVESKNEKDKKEAEGTDKFVK